MYLEVNKCGVNYDQLSGACTLQSWWKYFFPIFCHFSPFRIFSHLFRQKRRKTVEKKVFWHLIMYWLFKLSPSPVVHECTHRHKLTHTDTDTLTQSSLCLSPPPLSSSLFHAILQKALDCIWLMQKTFYFFSCSFFHLVFTKTLFLFPHD